MCVFFRARPREPTDHDVPQGPHRSDVGRVLGGFLEHPVPRHLIPREIAKRFAYLRRLVMNEMSRVLTPLGATLPLYNVLFRLAHEKGAVSQQELTLDAGLDAAGVSRLVARMAEEKLVTVRVDSRDRRRRLVRLTTKGRALEESLAPVIDGIVRNLVTGLDEQEEQILLRLVDKAVMATLAFQSVRGGRKTRREGPAGLV